MSRYPITPRTLLSRTQSAQFEASGEVRLIAKLHALALDLDDAEQPYVARQIELAAACTCGCGELQLPLIEKREQLDQAQRRLTEQAQQHVGLLTQFQRSANGLLESLRALVCRLLAGGGVSTEIESGRLLVLGTRRAGKEEGA